MARSLPKTDEAIVVALRPIVENANKTFGIKWTGDETVLSTTAFGSCVRHANLYWFEKKQDGLEYHGAKGTVAKFIKQLRDREKNLLPA